MIYFLDVVLFKSIINFFYKVTLLIMLAARLQNWEIVLHGTETLPEVDKIPSSTNAADIVNIEQNSIDDKSWKLKDEVIFWFLQ